MHHLPASLLDEFHFFGEEIDLIYRAVLRKHRDAEHEKAVEDAHRRVAIKHDLKAVGQLIKRFAKLAR